jgi:hypothetical protein
MWKMYSSAMRNVSYTDYCLRNVVFTIENSVEIPHKSRKMEDVAI